MIQKPAKKKKHSGGHYTSASSVDTGTSNLTSTSTSTSGFRWTKPEGKPLRE